MDFQTYMLLTEGEALSPKAVNLDDLSSASTFNELTHMTQYRWFDRVIASSGMVGKHLDASCGTGYGTEYLSRSDHVSASIGVDINTRHLQVARQNFKNAAFRECDVEKIGEEFKRKEFSFVTSAQPAVFTCGPQAA